MLVPAMTFAWWLVSMSAPEHHRAMATDSAGPRAEATSERQQQDAEDDEVQPAEAAESDGAETTDQGTGERVTLKVVTPAIVRVARTFLDLPMGAERTATIDGQRYVFVLEHHYHPPGFVGGPTGWHKGVTVYGVR